MGATLLCGMPPVLVWLEQHAGRTAATNSDVATVDDDAAGRFSRMLGSFPGYTKWRSTHFESEDSSE